MRRFAAVAAVLIFFGCDHQLTLPPVPLLGFVVGTVTRPTGAPALASVKSVAAVDSCGAAAQNTLGGIPLVTDSLGRYVQLIMAEPPAGEACVRIIANDYLVPDDSVVSAVVHVPLAPRSDTVRVDLILP